jgi:hypothetical protein
LPAKCDHIACVFFEFFELSRICQVMTAITNLP